MYIKGSKKILKFTNHNYEHLIIIKIILILIIYIPKWFNILPFITIYRQDKGYSFKFDIVGTFQKQLSIRSSSTSSLKKS